MFKINEISSRKIEGEGLLFDILLSPYFIQDLTLSSSYFNYISSLVSDSSSNLASSLSISRPEAILEEIKSFFETT